jgi:hypothetical protein
MVDVYSLRADRELSIFNLICHLTLAQHAVENKISYATCIPRLFPHTDTLHQPTETGKKAGDMTQQIKIFFHTHQWVFVWNESGVHDRHSLFKQC